MANQINSKKSLAVFLSKLKRANSFNAKLEQYITDSEVAATLLWNAFVNKDITGKKILDPGCGNGILGIGCIILGARHVTFADIDRKMTQICNENLKMLDEEFESANLRHDAITRPVQAIEGAFDTILMNPPFGIQTKHADQVFLEKAFEIGKTIYSIHDANTIEFLEKFARKHKRQATFIEKIKMHLRHTMRFHRKEKHEISVVLVKFE